MRVRQITGEDDEALASIIRYNLKKHGLDLPGTVYFDEGLDHLSTFYLGTGKRNYFIALDEKGKVIGGAGFAEFSGFSDCAELQKLYLSEEAKGHGYGYELIDLVLSQAKKCGYKKIYLETHTNLAAAIHMYEKKGFRQIEQPANCVHATMNRFFLMDLENAAEGSGVDSPDHGME